MPGGSGRRTRRALQAAIEQALFETLHWQGTIIGAGRTDAGVHALGQVAHFDIADAGTVRRGRFSYMLNKTACRTDIRVTSCSAWAGRRGGLSRALRRAHGKALPLHALLFAARERAQCPMRAAHVPLPLDVDRHACGLRRRMVGEARLFRAFASGAGATLGYGARRCTV